MRSQSKWLAILILVFTLAASGCVKKKKDPSAEALLDTPNADTATVDSALAAELPPIEEAAQQPTQDVAKVTDSNPQPAPSPDPSPEPTLKGSGEMATYTVQKGDTLMKIAFNIYGDISHWKNIYNWNKEVLKKASQLEKGTQLKYEKPSGEPSIARNGEPFLIKKGDTLASIADEIYAKKNKWKALWANNRQMIQNPNRIYAGFYLYYQITEQEKRVAEAIRAKRASSAASQPPTGSDEGTKAAAAATDTTSSVDSAGASAPTAPSSADPVKSDPGSAGALNNSNDTGGGLSALAGSDAAQAPQKRAPASFPAVKTPTGSGK